MNRSTPHPTTRRFGKHPAKRLGRRRSAGVWCAALGLGLLLGSAADSARGQSRVGPSPLGGGSVPMPEEIEQVHIDQNLGSNLPLDTRFMDEHGQPVKLGDYFTGDKPVVIEFAYFECPLLCPMVISGIIDATQGVGADGKWLPGEQFDIITISINPDDTPVTALEKQHDVVERLGGTKSALGAGAAKGWHFLTGREVDIKAVADAAGFGYAAVPKTSDYAHAAVLIFASPDGVITRYLPGHVYPERDFRMALVEASEGTQGSLFDMILQLCYHYDDQLGAYTADAMALMKFAGGVTVLTLLSVIIGMLYFERRRTQRLAAADGTRPATA